MCQVCVELRGRLRADESQKYTVHFREVQYPRTIDRSRWRMISTHEQCCTVWYDPSNGAVRIYSRHPTLSDPVWFPDGDVVHWTFKCRNGDS